MAALAPYPRRHTLPAPPVSPLPESSSASMAFRRVHQDGSVTELGITSTDTSLRTWAPILLGGGMLIGLGIGLTLAGEKKRRKR